jgi:hypothetical protein
MSEEFKPCVFCSREFVKLTTELQKEKEDHLEWQEVYMGKIKALEAELQQAREENKTLELDLEELSIKYQERIKMAETVQQQLAQSQAEMIKALQERDKALTLDVPLQRRLDEAVELLENASQVLHDGKRLTPAYEAIAAFLAAQRKGEK